MKKYTLFFAFFFLTVFVFSDEPIDLLSDIQDGLDSLDRIMVELQESADKKDSDIQNLKTTLDNVGTLIDAQGEIINNLQAWQTQLKKMTEAQKAYIDTLQSDYKFFKLVTYIAVPCLVAGSSYLTYRLTR